MLISICSTNLKLYVNKAIIYQQKTRIVSNAGFLFYKVYAYLLTANFVSSFQVFTDATALFS